MKRCPRCLATYPEDAAWCPLDATKLEAIADGLDLGEAPTVAGSITAGWDIPDLPAATPAPVSPSALASAAARPVVTAKPGAVTAGWDIPDDPDTTPAAPPMASDPAPPVSTLPGYSPPSDIAAVIAQQRAKVAAQKVKQPLAAPQISPELFKPAAPASDDGLGAGATVLEPNLEMPDMATVLVPTMAAAPAVSTAQPAHAQKTQFIDPAPQVAPFVAATPAHAQKTQFVDAAPHVAVAAPAHAQATQYVQPDAPLPSHAQATQYVAPQPQAQALPNLAYDVAGPRPQSPAMQAYAQQHQHGTSSSSAARPQPAAAKKNPMLWIVLGLVVVAAIVVGIVLATR